MNEEATKAEAPLRGDYFGPAANYRMEVVEWKRRRVVISFRMRTDVKLRLKARLRTVPVSEIRLDPAALDELTRQLTAFPSFSAMVGAPGHYRPTIRERDAVHIALADAYDRAQEARKDPRRAHRGSR